jgi:hypothetical protein
LPTTGTGLQTTCLVDEYTRHVLCALCGVGHVANLCRDDGPLAKDRGGPAFRYQALLIPALDTDFKTGSYEEFATGRFLSRDFMQFG